MQGRNDQGQLVAAAQIAKENNGSDALEGAKAWHGTCQQFDYVYQLKDGQAQMKQQIPIMFSKMVQGLRNMR